MWCTDVSAGWESERDPVAAPARSTGWKVEVGGGEQEEEEEEVGESRRQSGGDGKTRSSMLPILLLLLGVLPILHVCSEEVTVDTDACLRGAKARHGDNPNDELDSFLACVLARLDAVSFPYMDY